MTRIFIIFCFLFLLQSCNCDWFSDWMTPIQEKILTSAEIDDDVATKLFNDEQVIQMTKDLDFKKPPEKVTLNIDYIEKGLNQAMAFEKKIKAVIRPIEIKELALKDNIINARSGITMVQVKTLKKPTKNYIINDGKWTLCNGVITLHNDDTLDYDGDDEQPKPKCFGKEVSTEKDSCVFNSLIKYEVVPALRQDTYSEEDYLCLKPTFNTTIEQYYSVPRNVVDRTCTVGKIRSLQENLRECGTRMLADYTYFPKHGVQQYGDYCTERHGGCKLIVAWVISNSTMESLEFLKNDNRFKRQFMKM